MIVAEQKPLDEIRKMVNHYHSVLIVGCGTCMTVCDTGGESEVSFLSNALKVADARTGDSEHVISTFVVKRQCDVEFLEALVDRVKDADVVLSLGCGIGVQAIAERFPDIPVLPGVNTSFMGMAEKWGVWDERCAACGDCRLAETGGICPITRCTKGILNGPCAGTKGGKCEVSKDMDCAWVLIYKRLEKLQQLEKMRRYYPPRNFRAVPRPRRIMARANVAQGGTND